MAWSSGKDSALALHVLRAAGRYEVAALLTTVTAGYDRVSMHGVRRELLERQAAAIGLSLDVVSIPQDCSDELYRARMRAAMEKHRAAGVAAVAFGDLFLEDVRAYRLANLAPLGLEAVFPLWGRNTAELAEEFIAAGFRAVVTCVDTRAIAAAFAGREFDRQFLADLPADADPCGEKGEFHSFAYAGPIFRAPLAIRVGAKVLRDGRFQFCDVLPA